MNFRDFSNLKVKSIDEFKRDAFRRRVIANCLSEEFVTRSSEIKNKIKEVEEGTEKIIRALKTKEEEQKESMIETKESKIKELNEQRKEEIKKFTKIFEENHKKLEAEYEKQMNLLNEKENRLIQEVENEFSYIIYTSDPTNDPSYYIFEELKKKNVDTSIIRNEKEFENEINAKVSEYNEKVKEYLEIKRERIENIKKEIMKEKAAINHKFNELRNKIEEKEREIINKLNEYYDRKIFEIDFEIDNNMLIKIGEIENIISMLNSKKNNVINGLSSELSLLQNDFRSKIEILMDSNSQIPEDLLSKYIYSKIEIKKPEIKEEQQVEIKQNDGKSDNTQVVEKEQKKENQDTRKELSWSFDKEERAKRKEKSANIKRAVRIALSTIALSSIFMMVFREKLYTPSEIEKTVSQPISSISISTSTINDNLIKVEEKKIEDVKLKKNEEGKVSTKKESVKSKKITKSEKSENINKEAIEPLVVDIAKEIDSYNASKLNFEVQLEIFEKYVNEIPPKFTEILGLSSGKKSIANDILKRIRSSKDNLSKQKMDLISEALADSRNYDLRVLRNYIDKIIKTNDDQLIGVDPTGKLVPMIEIPKTADENKVEIIENKVISGATKEVEVSTSIPTSLDLKSQSDQSDEKINNEVDSKNKKPINEKQASINMYEELVDAIITCGDQVIVIKVPLNYKLNDDDPLFCSNISF